MYVAVAAIINGVLFHDGGVEACGSHGIHLDAATGRDDRSAIQDAEYIATEFCRFS